MRACPRNLLALVTAVAAFQVALGHEEERSRDAGEQVSLAPRGLPLESAPQWSKAPPSSKRSRGSPISADRAAVGMRHPGPRRWIKAHQSHAVKAQAHGPTEPDRERSIAFWERQFPNLSDPDGKMPFKVFGIDRDSPEYFKGPSNNRQFFPECEGGAGKCKAGTTICRIPYNLSEELGRGHKDYAKPCECENLDRCAVRREEGFQDCDCPSRTVRSRWDYETGEPRL